MSILEILKVFLLPGFSIGDLLVGEGGFLTKGYFSSTIDCCFPYCFLEIFVERQGFDGGEQSRG